METNTKRKLTVFNCDPELKIELKKVSAQIERPLGWLINRILKEYLSDYKQKKQIQ